MSIISWIRPDTFKDPRNQWMILAGIYFVAGVIFGTLGGEWYHIAGWLICGIFSWIFVYKGFPDMWIYSFHLAFAYIVSGIGVIVMFALPQWFGNGFLFGVAGLLIQIPSIILLILLFDLLFFLGVFGVVIMVNQQGIIGADIGFLFAFVPLGC